MNLKINFKKTKGENMSESMGKIYISGKMRGVKDFNRDAFYQAEDELEALGYEVFNPVRYDEEVNGWTLKSESGSMNDVPDFTTNDFDKIIKSDVDAVLSSDFIYMLKGWQDSQGAKAEKAVAEWRGKQVLYQVAHESVNNPTLIDLTAVERKQHPLASGVLDYFPEALLAVANCSYVGNEQHNPGKPLHWDRSKSGDESDALIRHFMERGTMDADGVLHSAKVAWRALALLQKELEA
jgi:hypothetical protein